MAEEITKLSESQREQKALEFVRKSYNASKAASSLDFERFARYYKLFRNKQTTKNYTGLANLFIPEPYRIVRKKTAKLANAIRAVKVSGETQNDKDAGKIGTHLVNFVRRKLLWKAYERTAIQESRITGLSWLKIVWDVNKEEEGRPYKGFDLSFASLDQVFLPKGTTALDLFTGDYAWLVNEYESDIETLKLNRNYKKEGLDILDRSGGSEAERSSLAQARTMYEQQAPSGLTGQSKKIKIWEFWGKYSEAENGEKDYLIVIADNRIVLRFEKNPYEEILDNPIPFVPFVANPIGKEMYPIGDIEPAESLFNELNDTRNQRMDTVTLNIDPAKEIVNGAQIDPKELIARRGWVIHSNMPNGIRFIPPDMQGVRAALEEEQAIRGDIQQVTGVIDFSPGSEVQAGVSIDTARGTIIAKGEADVLTEDDLQTLRISLTMLYRIVLAYSQFFLDRKFTMRVTEQGVEKFYDVDKNSIQGNLDLDVEMKTLQDKTTDQQLKLMLFNQAKEVPGAKLGKFFADVLESFYEDINIQDYYEQPQPVKAQPNISISLRGELNPLEVDEIYKMTGADPAAADPLMRPELRQAMRGNPTEIAPAVPAGEESQTAAPTP